MAFPARPFKSTAWNYLLAAVLAAGLALIIHPGGTKELLRIAPSGVRDDAGWTRLDSQFRPDRSASGASLKADDETFQFTGEPYAIPLVPEARLPEVFSVSLWVRLPADGRGTVPLLALEAEKGIPRLFLAAQTGDQGTVFTGATMDRLGNWRPLPSRQGRFFEPRQWTHLVYVVNHRYGVHAMYVDGHKSNAIAITAGECRVGPFQRLWLGSVPGEGPKGACQVRDLRFIDGGLAWWQILGYRITGRYFFSLFLVPPYVLWGGLWVVSLVTFALGARILVKQSVQNQSNFAAPISPSHRGQFRWLYNHLFLLAALAGFVFILLAFYPGAMSSDTIGQYQQGRDWRFSDWHPPFMAALLGIFDRVFHSPAPLLILQNALYWLGFYLLARALLRVNAGVACLFAVLGFWPAFLTWTGVLWKDVGTASTFLFAAALLVYVTLGGSRPRWPVVLAVVSALLYGALVRTYSFLAYLPLALWLAVLICRDRPLRRPRLAVAGIFLGLAALFLMANGLTNAVLKPSREHTIQAIFYHDLLGISVNAGKECLQHKYHRPDFKCADLKGLYTPVCIDTALFDSRAPLNRVTDTGPLFHDWLRAVRTHPAAYVEHRWNVFAILLGLDDRPSWSYFRTIEDNPFGFKLAPSAAGSLFNSYIQNASPAIFFGYVYLLFSVYAAVYLAVVLAVRRSVSNWSGLDLSILFLCLSALLYLLPYFFLCPSRDFRYLYWGTIASTLAFILMLYALVSAGRKLGPEKALKKTKR